MKYIASLSLALTFIATASWAQTPATPAPEVIPGAPGTSTACDATRQEMQPACNVNATSPECLAAKKTYTSCMAGFEAANGKGPCAQQNTLMNQFCTAGATSQQCLNARVSYNSCIQNPPGS